jgi:cephalosporin hydroxylase
MTANSNEQKIWDDYLLWFHNSQVWKSMTYHGIRTLKLPSDVWNYQEIIFETRADWVVETGTRHGGSALFFADTLTARRASGAVISVDLSTKVNHVRSHEKIHFLVGDSASTEIAAQIRALLPAERGPLFMILDSDHTRDHVYRELNALVPLLVKGDYLVVEDSCVNGHPVRPDFGPGPYEAVQDFIRENPGVLIHDPLRERKFGATGAPGGHFRKA